MANRFRTVDRETPYLFPPSVQEWLPETHLARFVVEVVSKLELRKLEDSYTKRGSEGYHPAVMLALLFYGYATGGVRVGSWSKPPTIRWRFATSPATRIRITTP